MKKRWFLCINFLVFMLFLFCKNQIWFAEFVVQWIGNPYKLVAGFLSSFLPFSLAELFWCVAIVGLIWYLVWGVTKIVKDKKGLDIFIMSLGLVLCGYNIMTSLWSVNYQIPSKLSYLELEASGVYGQDLYETCRAYARSLNELNAEVTRDEAGLFYYDVNQILEESAYVFEGVEQEYGLTHWFPMEAKAMNFSWLMSRMKYTGFYFAYTGEANVNVNQPLAYIPFTAAHELAHAREEAREQDCNFLAVMACRSSESIAYQYSGTLVAYIYLSNALHDYDAELSSEIYRSLEEDVRTDIENNNQYWAQFSSPIAQVSQAVYNEFLESNEQEEGVKSYGLVVDLLVADYLLEMEGDYDKKLSTTK